MNLPKKIKIAGYDFKIEEWGAKSAQCADRYGETSSIQQIIRIDTTHDVAHVINTFIHEVYHAIFWVYGIKRNDSEERIVHQLSNAMMQIYRDNPAYLDLVKQLL